MDRLDDFFQKKLSERDLAFDESAWEAASALLDERDRQRGKARVWFFLGIFIVATAGLLAFWAPLCLAPELQALAVPVASRSGAIAVEGQRTGRASDEALPRAQTIDSEQAASPKAKRTQTGPLFSAGRTAQVAQLGKAAGADERKAIAPAASSVGGWSSTGQLQADEAVASNAESPAGKPGQRAYSFSKLPTLAFSIAGASMAEPYIKPVRTVAGNHLAFGAIAGGSLYPNPINGGALLGVFAEGPLSGNWGWALQLDYRAQPLNRVEGGQSVQQAFGFGLEERTFKQYFTALHYLGGQLGATYRLGRHRWRAGGSFHWLAAGTGFISQTVKLEEQAGPGDAERWASGSLALGALPNGKAGVFAGYDFALSHRLRLGAQFNWALTGHIHQNPSSLDLALYFQL